MPDTDTQRDLLIAVALARFSAEFDTASPRLSSRAWRIAVDHADEHGLRPGEAIHRLDWRDGERGDHGADDTPRTE